MTTQTAIEKRTTTDPERMAERPTVQPPVDVFENNDEILLVADIPGVTKDQISIHIDKGRITFEGKVENDAFGSPPFDYRRTFVAQGIDVHNVSAEVSNGVLRIRLPKDAATKPRQIPVKAG
jgi:HSP20 family molecular chaperone IbpA